MRRGSTSKLLLSLFIEVLLKIILFNPNEDPQYLRNPPKKIPQYLRIRPFESLIEPSMGTHQVQKLRFSETLSPWGRKKASSAALATWLRVLGKSLNPKPYKNPVNPISPKPYLYIYVYIHPKP